MTRPDDCPAVVQPGTIITRAGVKCLYDATADDHPLTGWCQPCGLPLTRRTPGEAWAHRSVSAFWSVRQAGARWDWATYGIDGHDLADGLITARAEARAMSLNDGHGVPWTVELTEAGTRSEWARYRAGELVDRPRRGARR